MLERARVYSPQFGFVRQRGFAIGAKEQFVRMTSVKKNFRGEQFPLSQSVCTKFGFCGPMMPILELLARREVIVSDGVQRFLRTKVLMALLKKPYFLNIVLAMMEKNKIRMRNMELALRNHELLPVEVFDAIAGRVVAGGIFMPRYGEHLQTAERAVYALGEGRIEHFNNIVEPGSFILDLGGLDLTGLDLRKADLRYVSFDRTVLSRFRLRGAKFKVDGREWVWQWEGSKNYVRPLELWLMRELHKHGVRWG